jgi:signal peptidase
VSRAGEQSESSTGSPAVLAVRRVVAWALGLVLLTGTAGALGVAVYPMVTGGSALAVLSGSMTPGLPVGGMVFTRPVDPAEVVVGDVLTFQRPSDPSQLVTHRVLAIDTSGAAPLFTTKGDANDAADLDPVPASAVQGRLWFSVGSLGRVIALLHSPKGLGVLVVLVCAVVAASPTRPASPEDDDIVPTPPAEDPAAWDIRHWDTDRWAPVDADPATVLLPAVGARPQPPRRPLPVPGLGG